MPTRLLAAFIILVLGSSNLKSQNSNPPIFTSSPVTVVKDTSYYKYLIEVNDPDGDDFAVQTMELPEWLQFLKTASVRSTRGNPYVDEIRDGDASSATFYRMTSTALDNEGNIYFTEGSTVRVLKVDGSIETIAGGAERGYQNGTGINAKFESLGAIVFAPDSTLMVADERNNAIRNVSREGVVRTFFKGEYGHQDGGFSEAKIGGPMGLAYDSQGNLIFSDMNTYYVRKITPDSLVVTIAGNSIKHCGVNGVPTWCTYIGGNTDGSGDVAKFNYPYKLGVDNNDNIYLLEFGVGSIRKITPDGYVTTLAGGDSNSREIVDGLGSEASFVYPWGITIDSDNNIYVLDNRFVRKVSPEGKVTTLAGEGYDVGGDFNITGGGTLYFHNDHIYVPFEGVIHELELKHKLTGNPRAKAGIYPVGIRATDEFGNSSLHEFEVEVVDENQPKVLEFEVFNDMDTVFGDYFTSRIVFSEKVKNIDPSDFTITGDLTNYEIAPLVQVSNDSIFNIRVDGLVGTGEFTLGLKENNDISDFNNNLLIQEESVLNTEPLFKTDNLAPVITSSVEDASIINDTIYSYPITVVDENLATLDFSASTGLPDWLHILKSNWQIEQLGSGVPGTKGGHLDTAEFYRPSTILVDENRNLYVIRTTYFNKISHKSIVSQIPLYHSVNGEISALDNSGNIIAASFLDGDKPAIFKVSPFGDKQLLAGGKAKGIVDGTNGVASFNNIVDITVAEDGSLYLIDDYLIRKVDVNGVVTTLAGSALGHKDGGGAEAEFFYPQALDISPEGFLVVAESESLRKVSFEGEVTTIGGTVNAYLSKDGDLAEARFYGINEIEISEAGEMFFIEAGVLRYVSASGYVKTLFERDANPFEYLKSLALGPNGELYVIDDNTIKKLTYDFELYGNAINRSGDFDITINVEDNAGFSDSQNISVSVQDVTLPEIDYFNRTSPNQGAGFTKEIVFEVGFSEKVSGVNRDAFELNLDGTVSADIGNVLYETDSAAAKISIIINGGRGNINLSIQEDNEIKDSVGNALGNVSVDNSDERFYFYNDAPRFNGVSQFEVNAGEKFEFQVYPYDRNGHDLEVYEGENWPEGLTLTSRYVTDTEVYADMDGQDNSLFDQPKAIAFDTIGNAFVINAANGQISKISTNKVKTSLVDYSSLKGTPEDLAIDKYGNIYIADSEWNIISKISYSGEVSIYAGKKSESGFANGSLDEARFNGPSGITIDTLGNLYVADQGNHAIRKINTDGVVSTLVGNGSAGYKDGELTSVLLNRPNTISFNNSTGTIYFGEIGNEALRQIEGDSVNTVAGGEISESIVPYGIANVGHRVFFTHGASNAVFELIDSEVVSVSGGEIGDVNGDGDNAKFHRPEGLAYYENALYVADRNNNTLRKVLLTKDLVEGIVDNQAYLYFKLEVVDPMGYKGEKNYSVRIFPSDPPEIHQLNPSTFSNANSNTLFSVYWNKLVIPNEGKIQIRRFEDDSIYKEIDVNSDKISFDENRMEFRESLNLGVAYYILIPDSSFHDGLGQYFKGLREKRDWMFGISDYSGSAPSITSISRYNSKPEVQRRSYVQFSVLFNTDVRINNVDDILINFTGDSARIEGFESRFSSHFVVNVRTFGEGELSIDLKSDGSIVSRSDVSYDGKVYYKENYIIKNEAPEFEIQTNAQIVDTVNYSAPIHVSDVERDGVTLESISLPEWIDMVDDTVYTVSTYLGPIENQDLLITGDRDFGNNEAEIVSDLNNPRMTAIGADGTVYSINSYGISVASLDTSYFLSITGGFTDGPIEEAGFRTVTGIDVDELGNIYVVDQNQKALRKIDVDGNVTTLAGSQEYGNADGVGADARFQWITEIKVVNSDSILIGDYNLLRLVKSNGEVSTLAGKVNFSSNLEGPGLEVGLGKIIGLDVDSKSNIYIVDGEYDNIKKYDSEGNITIVAGNKELYRGEVLDDRDGALDSAVFRSPYDITFNDRDRKLYISSSQPSVIRTIDLEDQVVQTIAGSKNYFFSGFKDGNGIEALFNYPREIMSYNGDVYVRENSRIRKITANKKLVGNPVGQLGVHRVVLKATDHAGASTVQEFNIEVVRVIQSENIQVQPVSDIFKKEDFEAFQIQLDEVFITSLESMNYSVLGATNVNVTIQGGKLTFSSKEDIYGEDDLIIIAESGNESASVEFKLFIESVNDSPTNINLSNLGIAENSPINTVIGVLTTDDVDGGSHTYTIMEGSELVTLKEGELLANSVFDFETTDELVVRIKSQDLDGAFYEKEFVLSITDVNEKPLSLVLESYSLSENNKIGDVFSKIISEDPDYDDTYFYTLVEGEGDADNSLFEVDGENLLAQTVFDFETKNEYRIRLRVTDEAGLFHEEQMTLSVLDVNEKPLSLVLESYSLSENNKIGDVFSKIISEDPDYDDTYFYTLVEGEGDADNSLFEVDGENLLAQTVFDFETKNEYRIRLRVTDEVGLFHEEQMTLNILDVPEAVLGETPETLDFGIVEEGSQVQKTLSIENTGSADLLIESIIASSGFEVDWSVGTLIPGESLGLVVTFTPMEAILYEGSLEIVYSGGTRLISLSGEGEIVTGFDIEISELQDMFNVYPTPSANVVFMEVDNLVLPNVKLIELRSIEGRLLQVWGRPSLLNELDLSNYTEGVYLVRAVLENGTVSKKVIIAR
ncbi:putative secreted protein (Por secretion system target) [Roseivirga pacifica]|uniref:choice-of-anchor D domain-containing protein n=1 Tax=Roseivirga pacifica TaxID=1267423 RepID=UPI000EB60FA1|nr:choice-of-anchor D domain-containing protein [Roseivirga pacifica]RKQ51269.1 putative secreted protein (Por secretion system target) [Roseivirga pacifica]